MAARRLSAAQTPADEPQLLNTLPASWNPVEFPAGWLRQTTIWQTVNIDGDAPLEYILFFTYDNGQVGAVIYDEQIGPTQVTSPTPVPLPNQPSGLYMPYRLEPSFWTGAGSVGYIAPPGTGSDGIEIIQVQRTTSGPGAAPATGAASAEATTDELIINGGGPPQTVLTVVWWQNPYNGYGITQIAATGGLVRPTRQGKDGQGPIESITGLTPLIGLLARSVLCAEKLYMRADATEYDYVVPPVYRSAVKYVATNHGIIFCAAPPPYPFYPEGVVLAFLRPENPENPNQSARDLENYRLTFVDSNLPADQRKARLDQLLAQIDFDDNPLTAPALYVGDLRTPSTIPVTPDYRTPAGGPILTTVCAEVSSLDGMQVKRLLYQLQHIPPTRRTRQWGARAGHRSVHHPGRHGSYQCRADLRGDHQPGRSSGPTGPVN